MTCKTCKFLDAPLSKTGRIFVPTNNAFMCLAPAPEQPKDLPMSIINDYRFKWPPPRQFMWADDGEGCTVYEKRGKPCVPT